MYESSAESSCMGFLRYFHASISNHLSEKPKICLVVYGRLIKEAKNKGAVQTAQLCRLTCNFVDPIGKNMFYLDDYLSHLTSALSETIFLHPR